MNKWTGYAMLIGVVLFAVGLIGVAVHAVIKNAPIRETQELVVKAAILAKQQDTPSGEIPREDAWGRNIVLEREVTKTAKTYTVTSAGIDGKFGTADDVSAEAINLNKSRIVGEWVGTKAKEAVTGAIEGWKAESEFDDEGE